MDLLMGIDLGSTSLKAIVYDLDGKLVAQGSRPTEVQHVDKDHPDWAVWLPEQIWSDTAAAVKQAVGQLDDPGQIRAVAVTGMGMDGVPMDADGNWLYPFISWHCPRTAPQQQWWLDNVGAQKQFSISGNPVWAINTALRILWMREHEPAILDKTYKWLLIEDFLNFMLCGEIATDYSMASNTLLFDQRKRDYSDELLSISGIDRGILADPHPAATPLGKVHAKAADATGLPPGTPVILGGHDFLCACLPVGAFKPGVVQDVVGTWEIIVAAIDQPILTSEVLNMGWWVDSHVARNTCAAMGSAVAADMLEWFRNQFGQVEAQKAKHQGGVDWDHLMALAAQSPPGANGVMFLPHFSGSTIPIVDANSRGSFVGLRNMTTRGDMLRAIIEGLSFQFLEILQGVEKALKVTPQKFVAVGGGAQNAFWMQNKADMVARPIETPEIEEATPLGAAILAGIGVGLYKDEQDAFERVYKPGKVYEPNAKLASLYAERFEIYKQLYPALAPISRRLVGAAS